MLALGDGEALGGAVDFGGGLATGAALSAGDVDAQIVFEMFVGLFESAAGDGGDAGGVPVEPEDAAERLEPPWVGKSAEHFVGAIFIDDGHGDGAGESPHAVEEPRRGGAGVEGKLGEGALHARIVVGRAEGGSPSRLC